MLELKKEGLYIAQGAKTNVLIRVVGEFPMLSIASGVLLNAMVTRGEVVALTPESPEIQDIITNPKGYVFNYPTISESIQNEKGLDKDTFLKIEYSNETFDEWLIEYKECISMYKGSNIKFKAKLVTTGYSVSQADSIIMQIERRIKMQR